MTFDRQRFSRHDLRDAGLTANCKAPVRDDAVTDRIAALSNLSIRALWATRLWKDRRANRTRAVTLAD